MNSGCAIAAWRKTPSDGDAMSGISDEMPLLDVRDLRTLFRLKRPSLFSNPDFVHAVDGVSFTIAAGETLGLVGESGCGKSTLGRSILQLVRPTSGRILYWGKDIIGVQGAALKKIRSEMQIIFQDPYSSLNPRMTVEHIVGDALKAHGIAKGEEVRDRVAQILEKVGIRRDRMKAFPHEFSGGQRQRIGIARALILQPRLIVCDEPVSALDVSIQAQVINLLADIRQSFGLSYLMVAHDLSVVNHISDRIAVMYLGQIIELAPASKLVGKPLHPYTQTLIAAIPVMDPRKRRAHASLKGEPPSPIDPPSGCRFHPRCTEAWAKCGTEEPSWTEVETGRFVKCHLYSPCRGNSENLSNHI